MSLRVQMAGVIGGLLTLVIGTTAVGLYLSERSALLKKMLEARETQVGQFAQSLRDALIVHDDLSAMNNANTLQKTPGILEAYGVNSRGIVLAHGDPGRVGRPDRKSNGDRWSRPLDLGGERAEAVVVYSPGYLARAVDQALRPVARRISAVALAALLLGLAAAVMLAGRLIRPIARIAEGTRRIAAGEWSHRLALGRGNELKRLGEDFDKMAERLGEVDQMKRDFVSNVTHELRSPLSAIESYLNLVTDDVREGNFAHTLDHLTILRNNATRLGRFIDDVLDLSKIEAKALDLRLEPLDVNGMLGEVSKLFSAKAAERRVTLRSVSDDTGLEVWADADKMQQVLVNLVGNALKFTPSGGRVTLSARREDERVRLDVSDTGPGIPPGDLDRIFGRFEQSRGVTANAPKGTGLGLAIARGLVEAQNGRLSVHSTLGEGSVFSVSLPVAP